MARLLFFIILAAVAYIVIKSLLWLAFSSSVKSKEGSLARPVEGGEMIRDPACGIYIPKAKAIEGRVRGSTHYFCSPECLEKYRVSAFNPPPKADEAKEK